MRRSGQEVLRTKRIYFLDIFQLPCAGELIGSWNILRSGHEK